VLFPWCIVLSFVWIVPTQKIFCSLKFFVRHAWWMGFGCCIPWITGLILQLIYTLEGFMVYVKHCSRIKNRILS
jgi:hypothetical protein